MTTIKRFILYTASFVLRKLPPEASHCVFIFCTRYLWFLLPKLKFSEDSNVNFFGTSVKNCYGVAAGLDKNARGIKGLFSIGFGIVEIGTVTPRPQKGNAKPRVFRFPKEESVLNFMGFPNDGADVILKRVKSYKKRKDEVLGVNIGRNKDGSDDDYIYLIEKFHKYCDYITINISSPNTPNLRETLDDIHKLESLLSGIFEFRKQKNVKIPIFLKLTPDSPNLQGIYDVSCKYNIDGFILTNTTIDKTVLPEKFKNLPMGGVSGELLREKSFNILKEFNNINIHNKFVISCGGVNSNTEVRKRLKNGANSIQVYTPLIYGAFFNE